MMVAPRVEVRLRTYEWEVVVATLLWADKKLREDSEWTPLIDPRATLCRLAAWIEDQIGTEEGIPDATQD